VYVHNLSFTVSDETLRAHFAPVGQVVSAVVLRRGGDGRSKGCGLVTFATPAQAAKAIETLTETEIDNRKILVREVCMQIDVTRA
jgi:RNA recognition motif-containing protein